MRRSLAAAALVVLPALAAAVALTGSDPTARSPLVRAPLTCGPGNRDAASAFWVGLGGYSKTSEAIEQIGTDADCSSSGVPTYYAWYELYPEEPVILRMKIRPGDTITTSVNVSGNSVLFQLKNRTRGTVFTKRVTADRLDLTSAEWIAEAPSLCLGSECITVPLANFGSVSFSRIATIGNGHPGTLTDPSWTAVPIQLVPRAQGAFVRGFDRRFVTEDSTAGTSAPAGLRPDGRAFTLTWAAKAASPG
jgi:hypothetical protein